MAGGGIGRELAVASGGAAGPERGAGRPGDEAGIKAGDMIVRANGRALRNYLDWEAVQLDLGVGDTSGR